MDLSTEQRLAHLESTMSRIKDMVHYTTDKVHAHLGDASEQLKAKINLALRSVKFASHNNPDLKMWGKNGYLTVTFGSHTFEISPNHDGSFTLKHNGQQVMTGTDALIAHNIAVSIAQRVSSQGVSAKQMAQYSRAVLTRR